MTWFRMLYIMCNRPLIFQTQNFGWLRKAIKHLWIKSMEEGFSDRYWDEDQGLFDYSFVADAE